MKYSVPILAIFSALLTACGSNVSGGEQKVDNLDNGFKSRTPVSDSEEKADYGSSVIVPLSAEVRLTDTTFLVNKRTVTILAPKQKVKKGGLILCLPGWNFSRMDMCEKSQFCEKALAAGFALVLPEMGKSIYASKSFPETRKDWLGYPQLKFVTDTLIPHLQLFFAIFLKDQNNFVYGISTGGRGVGMLAVTTDSLIKAGASLSGDFNQTTDYKDNLMIGWYGSFSIYRDRWEMDNPYFKASKVVIPLYLAHGAKDKTVGAYQTQKFYEQLKKLNPKLNHVLHIKEGAEHDYVFWNGETDAVLEFFGKYCKEE